MRKKAVIVIVIIFILITIILSILAIKYKYVIHSVIQIPSEKVYYAEDFGIEVIKSNTDFDNDGIDDYTDILEGAKI